MTNNNHSHLLPPIRRIRTDEKVLVLTFDDGPDSEYSPLVLDILGHYSVPAVFFCMGAQVQRHPDVLERMVESGHIVANHSWNHPNFTEVSPEEVASQLEKTSAIIEDTVGLNPRYLRPPYGAINDEVAAQVHSLGYQVVLWDVDSVDWSGIPGPEIAAHVLPNLRSGSVILHHSAGNVAGTVDALPYEIEVARAMGFDFVALDKLSGIAAYRD